MNKNGGGKIMCGSSGLLLVIVSDQCRWGDPEKRNGGRELAILSEVGLEHSPVLCVLRSPLFFCISHLTVT